MSGALSEAAIAAELQHHPASSRDEAWRKAEFALRLREALLAEARRLGLDAETDAAGDNAAIRETEEEGLIRRLFDRVIRVADISDAECRADYERRHGAFRSPALFEAAHILIAADMASTESREPAKLEAERLAAILAERPAQFPHLAREHSGCPSGSDGGALGQVTVRDVTPEIASMLLAMEPGTICKVPVPTRHGYHLLRLDRREDGRDLPFDSVRERIRDHLRQRAWLNAARRYAATLIDDAALPAIRGAAIDFARNDAGQQEIAS